jgi:hypothetical protein
VSPQSHDVTVTAKLATTHDVSVATVRSVLQRRPPAMFSLQADYLLCMFSFHFLPCFLLNKLKSDGSPRNARTSTGPSINPPAYRHLSKALFSTVNEIVAWGTRCSNKSILRLSILSTRTARWRPSQSCTSSRSSSIGTRGRRGWTEKIMERETRTWITSLRHT